MGVEEEMEPASVPVSGIVITEPTMEPLSSVLEDVAPDQEIEPSIPVSRVGVISEEGELSAPVS